MTPCIAAEARAGAAGACVHVDPSGDVQTNARVGAQAVMQIGSSSPTAIQPPPTGVTSQPFKVLPLPGCFDVVSGVSDQESPSEDFQLTILPKRSPTATSPSGPEATFRIVAFFQTVACRCHVMPSGESRKTAEPSVATPPAANLDPVQATV